MAAPPAALMTAKVAMDRIEMQTQTRGKENRSVSPPKHFTFIYNTLPICYQIIIKEAVINSLCDLVVLFLTGLIHLIHKYPLSDKRDPHK